MSNATTIERTPFSGLRSRTKGDKVIWTAVVLLAVVSLLVVYSSTGLLAYKMYKGNTEIYLFKQFAFILVGVMIIYFAHQVNYTIYSKVAKILFIVSIPLLFYTLFFGVKLNEGSRWIRLPIINMTFQTSDLAKLALFMYLSRLLSKKQDVIKDFRTGFIPVITPVAVICLLIAPANLSTALLIGAAMIRHKTNGGTTEKPRTEGRSRLTIRVDTWISRVETFVYGGKEDNSDNNYQTNQAKIAIAKGGILGLGPGNSQQRNFLPHPYSDFIFAIIIEEYGLAGGIFIVFIYLVFLLRSIRIFRRCPFAFGAFLALGLSFTLVIQALANMAVNVNLFPVTGVTLPLVSMGGSSFLFTCLAIGIILSVARNAESAEGKAKAGVRQGESEDIDGEATPA